MHLPTLSFYNSVLAMVFAVGWGGVEIAIKAGGQLPTGFENYRGTIVH